MAKYSHTWRCRGPGGSHRLQNGWGVARRGPRWVRLPYASARMDCDGGVIWRSATLPSETAREQALDDFRRELASVLDWNSAQYDQGEVILHT